MVDVEHKQIETIYNRLMKLGYDQNQAVAIFDFLLENQDVMENILCKRFAKIHRNEYDGAPILK